MQEHGHELYDQLLDWKERAEAAEARVAKLEAALAVPQVWSEAERDGMSKAFQGASEHHGHYESLFAAAAWLLRHRVLTADTEPDGSAANIPPPKEDPTA